MIDWSQHLKIEDVKAGDEIPPITIPITLQRLVMEAGSNRDFSLIHHNREIAQSTGASDAYMNTFFILGLFERMLREWMGVKGRLRKIHSLQMKSFNVVGDIVICKGKVVTKSEDGEVSLELSMDNNETTSVTALAVVVIPT